MNDLFDFAKPSPLEAAFNEFHKTNPHIYELFKRFAIEASARREHYSVAAIWERIRWHLDVETQEDMANPDDKTRALKLNNNHKAYYVRMFHRDFPHMDGFFRTRTLTSKEQAA